jgi:hypothetical protein
MCANLKADAMVKVDVEDVLVEDFLGAGVQWSAYPWFDVTEADWQKVFKRVDHMQLPFSRVMVDMTTFFDGLDEDGEPKYLFDCELMQRVYKLLDYCEERDVTVMFGHWGWANTAKHSGGNWDVEPESELHAKISAALIDQVINKKGYKCVKWFDTINEPDGSWSSCKDNWEQYKAVVSNLQKELERKGMAGKIGISGTGDVYRQWVGKALGDERIRECLTIYNEHHYLWNKDVVSGKFEELVRERIASIKAKDPGKGYFAGELGFLDGKNQTDQQVNVYEFWYGVSMVDAAIQMLRAGVSGFLAWDMDDSMHWAGDSDGPLEAPPNAYERRKIWGFWNITGAENGMAEDENMRPWFYAWSALSRSFPKGCETVAVEDTGVEKLRVAAAKIAAGGKYHLSFAVVNNSDEKRTVKLVVPGVKGKVTLGTYEYFDRNGDNKVDAWKKVVDEKGEDIFPSVTGKLDVRPGEGFEVTLETKGALILTSLEGGKPVEVAK